MSDKIKLTNISGHVHSLRLMRAGGGYSRRVLRVGAFTNVTEDQFIDLYTSTKDFKRGYISFDLNQLSDDTRGSLGLVTKEELEAMLESEDISQEEKASIEEEMHPILMFTDEEIGAKLKGKGTAFPNFVKAVEELSEEDSFNYKKRIAKVAGKMTDELSGKKVQGIEKLTGINLALNEEISK